MKRKAMMVTHRQEEVRVVWERKRIGSGATVEKVTWEERPQSRWWARLRPGGARRVVLARELHHTDRELVTRESCQDWRPRLLSAIWDSILPNSQLPSRAHVSDSRWWERGGSMRQEQRATGWPLCWRGGHGSHGRPEKAVKRHQKKICELASHALISLFDQTNGKRVAKGDQEKQMPFRLWSLYWAMRRATLLPQMPSNHNRRHVDREKQANNL